MKAATVWTPGRLAFLKRHYGRGSPERLSGERVAAELGLTLAQVQDGAKHYAPKRSKRLGYRPWSFTERQFVKLHYGPLAKEPWTTRRIANALGRTSDQVYGEAQKVLRLGWREKRTRAPRANDVLAHYGRGLSDSQIAFALEWDRNAVQRWRKKRGLPPNRGPYGKVLIGSQQDVTRPVPHAS